MAMTEPVHYVGPSAVWCRDWKPDDKFVATVLPHHVTCSKCIELFSPALKQLLNTPLFTDPPVKKNTKEV